MNRSSMNWALAALAAGLVLPAGQANAGIKKDLVFGLNVANFQVTGQRNPLGQGVSINANRVFQNTPFDFGPVDLNLTGPVLAQFTTSRRFIPQVEFAFQLGQPGNPLFYNYTADTGGNTVNVTGSTVMNVIGSVNQFGWYDLQFQNSNRADLTTTGRFANTDGEVLDYDIGPVNISGNLFADLLATLTDPFYESAGFENIFASFSGRIERENSLESTVSSLEAKMLDGKNLTSQEVSHMMTMVLESQMRGDAIPDISFLQASAPTTDSPVALHAVPEAGTMALLALGGLMAVNRRRK